MDLGPPRNIASPPSPDASRGGVGSSSDGGGLRRGGRAEHRAINARESREAGSSVCGASNGQSPDGDVRGGVQSDPSGRRSPGSRLERAKVVFIVDKNGQLIAASGDVEQPRHDLSRVAHCRQHRSDGRYGEAPQGGGVRDAVSTKACQSKTFTSQLVGNRVILVVIFDSQSSSLGLVRLRVKKASEELNHIFESLLQARWPRARWRTRPFAEITDEDIDNLFND